LKVLESVDSTQDVLRALAQEGAPQGALVVAEAQRRGRGRGGRSWVSPPRAGLWFSLLLRPRQPPSAWPLLGGLAALAVVRAVRRLYSLLAGIKWPNDVLARGRKLAGILPEAQPNAGWVLLGIGINVGQGAVDFPPELSERATSLRLLLGEAPGRREELLAAILEEMEALYLEGFEASGPGGLLPALREAEETLGHRVRVLEGSCVREGVAEDLGPQGELILRLADGRRLACRAGHLEFRPERPAG
jgi:BirA family biotin operon repressor/biotin-[acetyl-CoA-carboxylase] ligase